MHSNISCPTPGTFVDASVCPSRDHYCGYDGICGCYEWTGTGGPNCDIATWQTTMILTLGLVNLIVCVFTTGYCLSVVYLKILSKDKRFNAGGSTLMLITIGSIFYLCWPLGYVLTGTMTISAHVLQLYLIPAGSGGALLFCLSGWLNVSMMWLELAASNLKLHQHQKNLKKTKMVVTVVTILTPATHVALIFLAGVPAVMAFLMILLAATGLSYLVGANMIVSIVGPDNPVAQRIKMVTYRTCAILFVFVMLGIVFISMPKNIAVENTIINAMMLCMSMLTLVIAHYIKSSLVKQFSAAETSPAPPGLNDEVPIQVVQIQVVHGASGWEAETQTDEVVYRGQGEHYTSHYKARDNLPDDAPTSVPLDAK